MQFSHGWLNNFKKRHNLSHHVISGESLGVNKIVTDAACLELKNITAGYNLNEIFNFDETALFYQLHPNKTLSSKNVPGLKLDKQRITIVICCNASGNEMVKPVVISKYARPRCFGKVFEPSNLVFYFHNKKAWMTCELFQRWL